MTAKGGYSRGQSSRGLTFVRPLEWWPGLPGVFMTGPKWRQYFGVRRVLLADVDPRSAKFHRPGKEVWIFSFEPEIRERVLEELRPDVYAEWSDPR